MNQTSFRDTGSIAANLAMTQPKGVEVGKHIEAIRAYVSAMHKSGRKLDVIRIKRDQRRQILDALNKDRKDNDPVYASLHWDGIEVIV